MSPLSQRLRVPGKIHGVYEPMLTIDTATDVPLISHDYVKRHPTLKSHPILPVPRSALDIPSVNGSPMDITGFISFDLTLEN